MKEHTCSGSPRRAVVLDQVPSQVNRCEGALKTVRQMGKIRPSLLRLVHSGATRAVITSLDAPHRTFDVYQRDSLPDDEKFGRTPVGKALQATSLGDATAPLQYDPATLVYGGWNSHHKGRQAKSPWSHSSEVVGQDPVADTRKANHMDPLNLAGVRNGDGDERTYFPAVARNAKTRLSGIGHGNIAPNPAHGGVTVTEVIRFSTLGFMAARRICFGSLGMNTQFVASTLLIAPVFLGDRLAFDGAGIQLCNGYDLVAEAGILEWIDRGGVAEPFSLFIGEAVSPYDKALEAAIESGAPICPKAIELTPSETPAAVIDFIVTKAESSEE